MSADYFPSLSEKNSLGRPTSPYEMFASDDEFSPETSLLDTSKVCSVWDNLDLGPPKITSPVLSDRHKALPFGFGELTFFHYLFAIPGAPGHSQEKALRPILSFLYEFKSTPQPILDELTQAYKTELIKNAFIIDRDMRLLEEEAQRIAKAIQEGHNQLVPCAVYVVSPINPYLIIDDHALGIRFSPDADPDFIICSIFNSGYGADKHHEAEPLAESRDKSKRKYDLEYVMRVPKKEITAERILPFLMPSKLTLNEAYGHFHQIPGTEFIKFEDKLEKLGREPKYKAHQKVDNCSLMWLINGYLATHLSPQNFHQVKAEMFKLALEEGLENPKTLVVIEKHADLVQLRLARKNERAAKTP